MYPSPRIPSDAKTFPLAQGTKVPKAGSKGHHEAQPGGPLEGNYGISLDDQFIVVDVDDPSTFKPPQALPDTWAQSTRRGHHLLYTVPKGLSLHNRKLPGADIKARGYIVGPGSTVSGHEYTLAGDRSPVPAPAWLIEFLATPVPLSRGEAEEQEGIPEGEHDEYLHKLASWLRGRYGLTPDTIARVLAQGPAAALLGVSELMCISRGGFRGCAITSSAR